MLIKSSIPARAWLLAIASAAILASVSCTTDSTPNSPSTTPPASQTPAPNPPTPPATTANVTVEIKPNPVPFSGQPITDVASCAGSANTWFYDQVFTETAGVAVHFTHRNDTFDGRVTNDGSTDVTVPAKGTTTIHSRWCSASSVSHTAVSTFTGTDTNGHTINASGGTVQLRSKN
jgi:hypothetical protein